MSTLSSTPIGGIMNGSTKRWWGWGSVLACLLVLGYSSYRLLTKPQISDLTVIARLPAWELLDQEGQPFGSQHLAGKVYLANFIFSRCPSVCPKMLAATAKMQQALGGEANIRLVTFTVDPLFDTPVVLKAVAQKYQTSYGPWTFLTFGNEETLFKLYGEGFKISVAPGKPATDLFDIAHSEKVVLVDQQGQIRGYYGQDPQAQEQAMIDARYLAANPSEEK